MAYYLGIDIGTTYTAAAVWRDGRYEIASLGNRSPTIPSVVLLRDDEAVLTGEAAVRRAATEPGRVAREFKRRIGDPTPIIVAGTPYSADALMAKLLRWVVEQVSQVEGGPPAGIAVSHPANWGNYKLDLLRQAINLADLDGVGTLSEPEAAAIHYASQARVEPGSVIAVYDLGGGTFDAAVLRKTASGWEILGTPEGIERLGGVDFDAAVFHHVSQAIGGGIDELDPDDPTAQAAVARLRQECIDAKEALSSDSDVSIPVMLPNLQTEVRLTRSEYESMVRPALGDTITAMNRALRSADVTPADVTAVLLVGGSSRTPLVAELVSSALGRPVAVDAHPKYGVATGAAITAALRAGASGAGGASATAGAPGTQGTPAGRGAPVVGAAGAGAALGAVAGAAAAHAAGSGEATAPATRAASAAPAGPGATAPPGGDATVPGGPAGPPGGGPDLAPTHMQGTATPAGPRPPAGGAYGGSGEATALRHTGADPSPGRRDTRSVTVPYGSDQRGGRGEPAFRAERGGPRHAGGDGDGGPGGPAGPARGGSPSRRPAVLVGAALVALALAGGAAYALTSGGGDGDDTTTGNTPGTTAAPVTTESPDTTAETPSTTEATPEGPFVQIDEVVLDGGQYRANYETIGYTPSFAPGELHVHLFLNTTAPENAGQNGTPAGSWHVTDEATSSLTPFGPADRGEASQMCAVVATDAHDVHLRGTETGNCVDLPS
ncbi:MAG TPA: Hsp70 family protein [Acidimicrobiales bacterium]